MLDKLINMLRDSTGSIAGFIKTQRIGTVVILIFTLVFFWPVLSRISSYSEGGDAMFNAWTLARDQHCILRENCDNYLNANIFATHKDTMLYSETQLSAGLLTLPFYFINQNPLFSYNIWTIVSFFLAAWFMYLLAKRLSKNNEFVSITAGLVFGYAPIKMTSVSHLQNLSIFYLPLIFLLMLLFMEGGRKRYAIGLFTTTALLFNASWYQLVFSCIAIGTFIAASKLLSLISWRRFITLGVIFSLSAATAIPLALQYSRFSKANSASFNIQDEIKFSSSIADYFIPGSKTGLGATLHKLIPTLRTIPFNPDSASYHGIALYIAFIVALGCILLQLARRLRRPNKKLFSRDARLASVFIAIGLVGLVFSLGPVLKIAGSFSYGSGVDGVKYAIPAPWLLINKLAPQLSFIRSIGRISILFLFALCSTLALLPGLLSGTKLKHLQIKTLVTLLCCFILFETLPVHQVYMSPRTDAYNITIPSVYRFIKVNPKIDNIVIVRDKPEALDNGFPFTRTEDVLWAGYHNKYIFNGYSGYEPLDYGAKYGDFVHFEFNDVAKMRQLGMKYLLLDIRHPTAENPTKLVPAVLGKPIFADKTYRLYRL